MATDPNQLLGVLLGTVGQQSNILQQAQQNALAGQQADDQHNLALQQQAVNGQQIAAGQQEAAQQAAYQNDVSGWINGGADGQGLSNLIAKYPKQWQALQQTWKIRGADVAQADLRSLGAVYNALDNGSTDVALSELKARRAAEAVRGINTDELDQHIQELESGNPTTINAVKGWARANIAAAAGAAGDSGLAKSVGVDVDADRYKAISGKGVFDTRTGKFVEGGDPASTGGAADGSGGPVRDTSRLINSDAGGGYVPDSVQTVGQFIGWGKALNAKGAKSSSAGTYQINGSTMAQFAPQALGPNWQSQPFNADTQDKVGEAIFNWAKAQPDPAAALAGRWVSLSKAKAAQLVKGSWNDAKATIAAGETGGGPGASATAGTITGGGGNSAGGGQAQAVGGYSAAAIENAARRYADTGKFPTGLPKGGAVQAAIANRAAQLGASGGADNGMVAGMTKDGLDRAAYVYNQTGKFPTGLGRGGEAQRAILNRAAELAAGQSPGQIMGAQASLAADRTALNNLEKNTGNVLAFERTALLNGALAVRKAIAVDNGGVPVFNKWVNAGRRATGDSAVSQFDAAVETFANEFAKVTTSATGGGVTSDSARQHARDLINTAQTPEQFFGVMRTLQQDMENRRTGLLTERKNILQRITGAPANQPQVSKIPAGFRVLGVRAK